MIKQVVSKNETFQQIPDYLLGELQENYLKPIDICVYFTLKSHAGQDRVCWPSISTIAKRCNRSTSTIDGSISRLKERGHIERKQKKFNGSAYTTLLTYVEKNVVTIGKPLGSENEQSPQPPLEECPFENWVTAPHQPSASTHSIQHETPSMIRTNHMNKLYELITCMKYMLSLRFTALAVIFKNEWLVGHQFPEILIVTSRLYNACGPRSSTLKPMTTMCGGTESV